MTSLYDKYQKSFTESLYAKYRKNVSEAEENAQVEEACQALCLAESAAIPVTPCTPAFPDARFFKNPGMAAQGAPRFNAAQNIKYRCWSNLPTLEYGKIPSNYLGDAEALKAKDTACYKCRTETRTRIQLSGAVKPDVRFWVGAGAATVGVLIAVMVKISRK